MLIALVITDTTGRNQVFVTDSLKAFGFEEMREKVRNEEISSLHIVRTGPGSYLRGNPNSAVGDNLDALSISAHQFFAMLDNSLLLLSLKGFKSYWTYYLLSLNTLIELGESVIIIDGIPRTTKERVRATLQPHRKHVFAAAKDLSIDPFTLGAIIIDEIARMAPFEKVAEAIVPHILPTNASVGIAQIKLETARGLIKNGYYNPNPADKKLSEKNINKVSPLYLYKYVIQPNHNVHFAAAAIKSIIDQWKPTIDIASRPEIIGTLYHQPPRKPNLTPGPDGRGQQIASEFYAFAKIILQS